MTSAPFVARLFSSRIHVINVGVPLFAEDLKKAGVPVTKVEWRPPAGGNEKVAALLERIRAKCEGVK